MKPIRGKFALEPQAYGIFRGLEFEPDANLSRYRRGIGQISADFERGRFAEVSMDLQSTIFNLRGFKQ